MRAGPTARRKSHTARRASAARPCFLPGPGGTRAVPGRTGQSGYRSSADRTKDAAITAHPTLPEPEETATRTPVVWSHTEWDPLEKIVVGRLYGAAIPPRPSGGHLQHPPLGRPPPAPDRRPPLPPRPPRPSPAGTGRPHRPSALPRHHGHPPRPDRPPPTVRHTRVALPRLLQHLPRDSLLIVGDEITGCRCDVVSVPLSRSPPTRSTTACGEAAPEQVTFLDDGCP